jgi:hypothetical protein
MNKIFKQGICALFSLCVCHAASAAESISVLHWWTSGGESNYVIAGEPQTHEAIACMLPKGDAALKAVLDEPSHGLKHMAAASRFTTRDSCHRLSF